MNQKQSLLIRVPSSYDSIGTQEQQEQELNEQDQPEDELDAFFTRVYNYYIQRGFVCIVVGRMCHLITLLFTILLSTSLLLFVDWHKLSTCSGDTCLDLIVSFDLSDPTLGELLTYIYFVVFMIYWLWLLIAAIYTCLEAKQVQRLYQQELLFTDDQLPNLSWCTIAERMVHLNSRLRWTVQKPLTELDIAIRIMRKDNYLIALLENDVFQFAQLSFRTNSKQNSQKSTESKDQIVEQLHGNCLAWIIFGTSLEWNIKWSLNSNPNGSTLNKRFKSLAVLNLVLLPFILAFLVFHFLLRHTEELYSKKSLLTQQRQFVPLQWWRMREYNELSHFYEQRIQQSEQAANQYLNQFPGGITSLVAQMIAYLCAACIAVLLAVTLMDGSLLNQRFWNHTGLWWLACFSFLLTVSRAMIEEGGYHVYTPGVHMKQLFRVTHYMPSHWSNSNNSKIRSEFCRVYRTKLEVFLTELICVLVTPYLLWFHLAPRSAQIVDFLETCTMHINGLGPVCGFALLNVDNVLGPNRASRHNKEFDDPLVQKKLQSSLLSFALNHPEWQADEEDDQGSGGSQLLQTLFQQDINQQNQQDEQDRQVRLQVDEKSFMRDLQQDNELLDIPMDETDSILIRSIADYAQRQLKSVDFDRSYLFDLLNSTRE